MNQVKTHLIFLLGMLAFNSCSKKEEPSWSLEWPDEFDGNGKPDASKWAYDLGDGCPMICGWGVNAGGLRACV